MRASVSNTYHQAGQKSLLIASSNFDPLVILKPLIDDLEKLLKTANELLLNDRHRRSLMA